MTTRSMPEPHWSEGQLLRQHHFQVLSRNVFGRLDDIRTSWGPARWGVRDLDLDVTPASLNVRQCRVVMPSGTNVDVPGNCVLAPLPLDDWSDGSDEPVAIRLAIPVPREDTPLIVTDDNPSARFVVRSAARPDENSMDPDSEETLEFRFLNGRLLLGDEDSAGYETLKIAELVPKGKHEDEPVCSPAYVPPLADITASPILTSLLDRLCLKLRDTNRALARDVASRHHTLALERSTNPEAIFKLDATNTQLANIEQLCRTKGVHPFDTYRALCQLAGALAIFTPERRCPDFPDYDHERIEPCFRWLTDKINEFLEYTWSRTWDMVEFERVEPRRFTCPLERAWLDRGRELFVGISADGVDPRDLDRLVDGSVKLVGDEDVSIVHHAAVPGIALARNGATPPRLPDLTDVHFYRVDRDATPPPRWRSLEQSARLCLVSEGQDLAPYTFGLYVTFENQS